MMHGILFAQRNQPPPPEAGAAIGLFVMSLVCLEFALIIAMSAYQIWYLIVKIQTLSAIAPHNRTMEPAMVLLMFIPLFGVVWYFIVVMRIAESLENEYRERGLPIEDDFGRTLGITAGVLNLTCILALIGLVCGIMHLLKLRRYTKELDRTRRSDRSRWRDDFDRDDDRRSSGNSGDERIREM